MSESVIEKRPDQAAYELGTLVGRHEALGLIAGRCSAADAVTLRSIREGQLWRSQTPTWNDFCETRLKMSRGNANRLIRLLDEFGENYFNISSVTRMSPEVYRAIAPSIRDNALHVDGEAIALTEENAPRIAAAVDDLRRTNALHVDDEEIGHTEEDAPRIADAVGELRRSLAKEPAMAPAATQEPLDALHRRCYELLQELTDASHNIGEAIGRRALLSTIVVLMQSGLATLQAQIMRESR